MDKGMHVELMDVGRYRFTGKVYVTDEAHLIRELRKHLVSREVWIEWDGNSGTVFAGCRPVGSVARIQ